MDFLTVGPGTFGLLCLDFGLWIFGLVDVLTVGLLDFPPVGHAPSQPLLTQGPRQK